MQSRSDKTAGPLSPQVIGRYTLYGKVASGGMATVHFGRQTGAAGFTRTVAIKRLHPHLADDPEFRSTMIDEARLAARIHHPHVVPILDVVAVEGELLLVMEYIRGESLANLLRGERERGRPAPLAVVSAVIIGALHGLHAAHEATSDQGQPLGIVHRDVSPQNILVGIDGLPRIIDFGVAKAAGRLQTTREGVVKGKVSYMAPEHLEGRPVSRAVDIYAMGVVLWEALAGRRLFDAETGSPLLVRILAGVEFPPSHYVSGLPPELDALVMKALAPDPLRRFSSAEAMADDLRRVAPPAFATDVGNWVREVAGEAMTRRGQILAGIESSARLHGAAPADLSSLRDGEEDGGLATVALTPMESTTGSMVTPRGQRGRPRRGGVVVTVLGVMFALAAASGIVRWSRLAAPLDGGAGPIAAAAPPPALVPEPSTAAASAPAAPSASAAAVDAGAVSRAVTLPDTVPRRVHAAPKAPIRFANPD